MDRGKKYSLKKLAKLANNLGQVVKLTILYNLEQNGTSKRAIGILYKHTRITIIDIDILQFL